MLSLSDVTLCAADCLYPRLAARAIRKSLEECEFGDAILFSDTQIAGPFRHVSIPRLKSRPAYSEFILKQLITHITTPYVLIVQWDGYVLSARAWRDEFKDFDYVGAPWPWYQDGMQVGNGGFSLRSRRLLQITAVPEFEMHAGANEDELIGRIHRNVLEQRHGMRIAPVGIAERFSYERAAPETLTFGFHGLFNMWRHVEDSAMLNIVSQLSGATISSREFFELLAQYIALRKYPQALMMFNKMRQTVPSSSLKELAEKSLGNAALANELIIRCERLARAA